ncbi:MAG TPA: serine/threonine-protein kinase, partial [Gemmataceae bacterium]|nr:serine/threonine-protein kinase [Gemmataceae bacterium]
MKSGPNPTTEPTAADELAAERMSTLNPGDTSASKNNDDPISSLPQEFGRYRVIRKLGEGGMGAVYFAHDTQLDRPVALKIPRFSAEGDPRLLERFRLEARAAAAFHHPNLCPVYDVGQVGETHFLTMAYLEGKSLAKLIANGPPMSQVEAARLVQQIAAALAFAHRRSVVHRDLKPANIMIQDGSVPVVMDFGLAHRSQQDVSRLTRTGEIMGTPAYMSPEQVEGDVDAMGPGCDIYSLGVILYEMLVGRLPFRGSMATLLAQILTKTPESPKSIRPDLDPKLNAICMKAMAKKAADRYADADQMAAELAAYLQTASGNPPATSPAATTLAYKATSGRRRGPLVAIALAAVAACAVAAGVVFTIQTDYGSVKIELNDPAAHVDVKLDGSIEVTGVGDPIRLRAGEHGLVVTGKDFETVSKSFSVRRGKETVVQVSLAPLAKVAAAAQKPAPKSAVKIEDRPPEPKTPAPQPAMPPKLATLPLAPAGSPLRYFGYAVYDAPHAIPEIRSYTNLVVDRGWLVQGDRLVNLARERQLPVVLAFHRLDRPGIEEKLYPFLRKNRDVVAAVCFDTPYNYYSPEQV